MKGHLSLIAILILGISGLVFADEAKEITGEVIKIEEMKDSETNTYTLMIQVRLRNQGDEKQIQNQEMVNAHLGPVWMFDTEINPGDGVVLKGKYNEQNHFMVREMVRNNIRYRIRGENGEPLWIKERVRLRSHFYNPATEKSLKCKIDELYVEKETNMMVAKAKLQNGETVQLRFAPEWFLQNRLRIGDEIELRGSEANVDGQKMVIAREMRNLRTRQEIQLRNSEGFPEWCGKGECEQHRTSKQSCCGQNDKEHGRKKK
ncbi:MAG: hypothetical protein N3A65_06360 [candidate division WOR-3 bacterium]|nr:hypothetical protein [candidate division WOR-3 bacterium]